MSGSIPGVHEFSKNLEAVTLKSRTEVNKLNRNLETISNF